MTNRRVLVAFGVALVLASLAMASPRTRSGSVYVPPAAADRSVYPAVQIPEGMPVAKQAPPSNLAETMVFSQSANGTYGIAAQNFEAAYNAYDVFVADDFTPNAQWDIDKVVLPGFFWNGYTFNITGVNVWFTTDTTDGQGRHHPGSDVCFWQGVAPESPNNPTVTAKACGLTPPYCRLSSGTRYWMAAQVDLAFGPYGQWGLLTHTPVVPYESNWKNPNSGFGLPCTTYGYRCTQCTLCIGEDDHGFSLYTGACTGGGGGGGGSCDLTPIEAKLDDETRFTDDTELAVIEGKLDAIQASFAALPCDILEVFLPILHETLPTTHPCYVP